MENKIEGELKKLLKSSKGNKFKYFNLKYNKLVIVENDFAFISFFKN